MAAMEVLLLIPDSDPDKPAHLHNLGVSWLRRYMQVYDTSAIENACECLVKALELIPDGHPGKPGSLNSLGLSWKSRFEQLGHLIDLDKAIECQSLAVELIPDDHIDKPGFLGNLGASWQRRFERLGQLDDLDKAIECALRGGELTQDSHPAKPLCLNNLGIAYNRRFQRFGNLSDINNSIICASQAVALTPDGHPDKPVHLNNLANSWQSRHEQLGELADIDKAIVYASQAVEFSPAGHPNIPWCLSNLGMSWHWRFKRLGHLSDIDKAIECVSRAEELTQDGHPNKPGCLNNLAVLWGERFQRLGHLSDLDKAIECQSRAVELTQDGHPSRPGLLSNLGTEYRRRFERFGNLIDIDKAILCASQAVELTPDGHPDKSTRLNNLANSWQSRHGKLGNLADIDKAIVCASKAIALSPDSHQNIPMWLNGLGVMWKSRFEVLGSLVDIDKAIEYQSQANELTPDDYPSKPGYLGNLGKSWQVRFERHGRTEDLETSARCFQNAAELVVTGPLYQLLCARTWAQHSLRLGCSPLNAYQRAFALLPQIVSLGQTIQERYDSIILLSDLAAEAAAWAVAVGLYDFALECLEQGRSVVWSQTLQLRTPFEEIAKVDSDLAHRLKETASQLDVASSRSQAAGMFVEPQRTQESQAQQHRRLAERWDKLLAEARQLPGFEGFMLPRTSTDLKRAATDGPVVVINTHHARCDALVIFPECDDVAHIPLESITNESLTETCSQVISLVGRRGTGARRPYFPPPVESQDSLEPLTELWLSVVGPVLSALACTSKLPYDKLPHVTWCATGALSFLPLHAAGLYDGQSPNAFDLIISSYTPTLSALLPRSPQTVERAHGVLAVGQANTDSQPPLPMTEVELESVKKYTKLTSYRQLDGELATVKATLDAMEQHSWVHLACHGVQNRDNPSHSAFYLHDGCLTLEEIAKRKFTNKGLAFLSACQTATGDEGLPDEATHLAAGMLTAGYPSVIATMWSIMDADGPEIAEEVYAELMKDGTMSHRHTAIALHKAVGKLREKVGVGSIDRWAPFIHVGV